MHKRGSNKKIVLWILGIITIAAVVGILFYFLQQENQENLCGNNICDQEEDSEICPLDCEINITGNCILRNPKWGDNILLQDETVMLSVEGENCEDLTVTFKILDSGQETVNEISNVGFVDQVAKVSWEVGSKDSSDLFILSFASIFMIFFFSIITKKGFSDKLFFLLVIVTCSVLVSIFLLSNFISLQPTGEEYFFEVFLDNFPDNKLQSNLLTVEGEVETGLCGDGLINNPSGPFEREVCDTNNLSGTSCQDLGFESGTLGCNNECKFDISDCQGESNATRVFISSIKSEGDLGEINQLDAFCQSLADDNSLTGSWKAWLSDSEQDVETRFNLDDSDKSIILIDYTLVADSWQDLTNGEINHGIYVDEKEKRYTRNDAKQGDGLFVWTGTNSKGKLSSPTCSDWSSKGNSKYGVIGFPAAIKDGFWTDIGESRNCNLEYRIYCFEQKE